MGINKLNSNHDLDLLLKDKFTSPFRSGYVEVSGITMQKRFEEIKEDIDNFEVFDDDVWVCSFPKTGTTWTQEMVWLIGNEFDYERATQNIEERFPFLEVSAVFDFRDLALNNTNFETPFHMVNSVEYAKAAKRPRFIKTHLPWCLLPKQIQTQEKKPKIIYVARNAKDTCISYYHHSKLLEGYSGNFDEFRELFMAGKVPFGPFWNNILSFWNRRDSTNVLLIKYEDMKQDLPSIITEVANFLSKSISPDQFETLVRHLSFDEMKKNKAVNYEHMVNFQRKYNLCQSDGSFMRSGKDQNHKAELSEKNAEEFDVWIQENTANMNLTL